MSILSLKDVDAAITRALGQELHNHRADIGWTRKQVTEVSGIHGRTLTGYELGQRHCTVAQFVAMCEAMEVAATDILGRALQRARRQLGKIPLRVDLNALVDDPAAQGTPLYHWAHKRLVSADNDGIARVSPDALQEIAAFVGVSTPEVIDQLLQYSPGPISPSS